ncbi:MAG: hypothetical protein IJG85_07990 [Eubacteriaceae bacterium]|nr:hypothetical protein [Eubacteriaceae bacterium]
MKKLFSISFFLTLLAILLFSPTIIAAEKTVYIDQTVGVDSDTNDGSASAPFQSISKALSSSEGNDDLIIILNNCYTLNDSQTFNAPLKEDGTPRAVTIEPSASGYFSIGGGNNADIVFKDITFDGSQSVERSNSVFSMTSGTLTFDNVNIRNICHIEQDNSYIQLKDGSFARIDGGTLHMRNGCTIQKCGGQNGIFYVNSNGTMTISGDTARSIVFSECHSTADGVIYNIGALSVDHADFQKNQANNSGGAIFNKGMATISYTSFDNNKVLASNNASYGGGAIYNYSTSANKAISIDISNCRFTNNKSVNFGGAVNNHGTFNGTDLTFENNTAQNGSAIYAATTKVTQNNSTKEKSIVNLTDCTTANNQSILTDSNNLTLCGGTYQGPIQLGTNATNVIVKKDDAPQNTVISDLRLGNGQYINYSGGFTKDCRVDFHKEKESITNPLQIVQGQFNSEAEINAFHLNDDQYRLEIVNNESNNHLKAVEKQENGTTLNPSINYAEETAGVDTAMEWKTSNSGTQWQPCRIDMPLGEFGWDGTKAVDIFVRYAATNDLKPSAEVSLTIPARPNAPTGLTPHDESTYGADDGSVEGVTNDMAYRTISDDGQTVGEWTDVDTSVDFDSSKGKFNHLTPGSYQFRIKASENSFASPPGEILEIKAGAKPVKPAVKPLPDLKKQINYTDESITVTKGMRYRAADGKWFPCEGTMPLETFGWDGSVEVTVTFRDQDGRKNTLTIPPRAAIEDGVLNAVDEAVYGQGGAITGVNENMEYRPLPDITTESEGEDWIDCAASPHFDKAAGTLKNMPAGDYQFRTKASVGHFAGMPVTVTVRSASLPIPQIAYRVHGKNYGWSQGEKISGETAGTTGECLRVEAINLKILSDNEATQNLSAAYRVHMADIGWSDFVKDGETAGTTGECRRLEAFEAKLTGEHAGQYNLWYRVHAKDIGWMPWVKNGETAGTTGECRRIEAIEIKILAADDNPPGIN